MQLEPRKRKRSTPVATALSNRLAWIRKLSEMKSAGRLELAAIPPTRAAADITTSGLVSWKNAAVARASRRSSSSELRPIRFSKPWSVKWRHSADPTNPRCPATKIRVFADIGVNSRSTADHFRSNAEYELRRHG